MKDAVIQNLGSHVGLVPSKVISAGHRISTWFPADLSAAQFKIALFSGNYNCVCDGANRALNRLMGHVLSHGHSARIYSPTVTQPAFSPVGDLVAVPSFAVPGRPEYRFAMRLPRKVAVDVRAFKPDIIHVSAPDGLNVGAIRLARTLGVPVVASMHTRFETYLEYYGLGLMRGAAAAWLRRFYNRCDMVLVPNAEISTELRADGITVPIQVWSRGVDTLQFSPNWRDMAWRQRNGVAAHEFAVLFFGRLVAEKGTATFAAVIARLRAAGLPIRPLVVGDGPERNRFANALGDALMTGHLAGSDLGRAVASADLFLNPSLTEAFGNVTLEAMASGVPVVAADATATRALIDSGRSGLLVPGRNIDEYVRAILNLVAHPARRAAISKAAIAVADRFDWSATLDTVIEGYRNVIDSQLVRKR